MVKKKRFIYTHTLSLIVNAGKQESTNRGKACRDVYDKIL